MWPVAWLVQDVLKITVFDRRDARVQTAEGRAVVIVNVPCVVDVSLQRPDVEWGYCDNYDIRRPPVLFGGVSSRFQPEMEQHILREVVLLAREFLESPEAEPLFAKAEIERRMLAQGCTPDDIVALEEKRDKLNEELRQKRERYRELMCGG